MNQESNPRYWPALYPCRIVIGHARRRLALQHSFQVSDCVYGREASFAQVHLIAVFERAEQFHPVKRTEIEIGIEAWICRQFPAERWVIREIRLESGFTVGADCRGIAKSFSAASAISARRGFWVEVRGKSSSGQMIQRRMRWYSARDWLARSMIGDASSTDS